MADLPLDPPAAPPGPGWLTRLAGSPRFHALVERIPGLRRHSRAEGRALFDIVAGFVHSQALVALVELGVLDRLAQGPAPLADLARLARAPQDRMAVLLQAGAALRLVRGRGGVWRLTARGAAFRAVPGLAAMVRHHGVLYGDLSDPAAFFQGRTDPALARFWPYVFGEGAAIDPARAQAYSRLMTDSQALVAEDTLRMVDLSRRAHLMDVGGGTGTFLSAVAARHPALQLTLFDLPQVVAGVPPALAARLTIRPGSFRTDPLPQGADTISLIRVLYDHPDETVGRLLAAVQAALPPGGMVLVSEPMSGGDRPDPATDVYFAVYTLAMQTGRTRTAADIAARLTAAGFAGVAVPRAPRPFVTSAITARKE